MRPADLAREHGISTQAIRNYERDGFLPPAERTPAGYRIYTGLHASALRAYLALVPAYGHPTAGSVMTAVHTDRLGDALAELDLGHAQLLRDRETLSAVREAVGHLGDGAAGTALPALPGPRSVGEVAHRLGVTPATLRAWEAAGILTPARDRATGHRRYLPADVRDAELAHLLRRGGYLLDHIATVLRQIRTAGGTGELSAALDGWQQRLTTRGLAMLTASARLDDYLSLRPVTPGRA
ncbi:TioE family transcriptional regulator [Streptomyces sp. CBMA156]|uniref:TioE family transcriptional regulator n=1 Tax=Streptomyces sp. CBMA156 TaxID=1930280 RepID=UPI00166202B1|nr:TioE family transcriptional regulator [Streptomyces sp. CBMA156]MBD0675296.1 MerR family transcriptional regulator [Streptomyces sp. CBMA156]